MLQWLGLHLPLQGVWVWSLVGKLGSPMTHGQKTKTETKHYCNKFNRDFKNGPHKKRFLKKLLVIAIFLNMVFTYILGSLQNSQREAQFASDPAVSETPAPSSHWRCSVACFHNTRGLSVPRSKNSWRPSKHPIPMNVLPKGNWNDQLNLFSVFIANLWIFFMFYSMFQCVRLS